MKQALSKRKRAVLEVMSKPKYPAQIRRQMGLQSTNNLSSTMRELIDLGLVDCLNPRAQVGKLYGLTMKGEAVRRKLLSKKGITYYYVEPSDVNWKLYGWIVCGKQRRAMLKAMRVPMPLRALKQGAQEHDPKISRENAHDILQLFVKKRIGRKIVANNRVIFKLTKAGEAIRGQLLEP